jgi:methyl-accepting chemotaxis protein
VGDGIRSVDGRVDSVVEKMVQVSGTVQEQTAVTSEVTGNIAAVAEMISFMQSNCSLVTDAIQKSSGFVQSGLADIIKNPDAAMLVLVAKSDHATFKKRIIDTILGKDNQKSHDLPDYHGCRLGKWYDAINDERIRNLPTFRNLEEPHSRVHVLGKKTLDLVAKGDQAAAIKQAIDLDKASQEVIAGLDDLYKAIAAFDGEG